VLGQHTDEMMLQAGFDHATIERLASLGIIHRGTLTAS
jgi:hypothetical protein